MYDPTCPQCQWGTKLNEQSSLAATAGSVRACEMERISREGKCGKPASGFWIHDDGTKTAVCDMCALSVMVNGGKLEEALNDQAETSATCDVQQPETFYE